MRLLLGLDHASSGQALIDGRPYAQLRAPMRTVGAHLDGRTVHPGRSAHAHLLGLARHNGISRRRVDEVIGLVGLSQVARRRAGSFSLGIDRIGELAFAHGVQVHGLAEATATLEEGYLRLVQDEFEFTVALRRRRASDEPRNADDVRAVGRMGKTWSVRTPWWCLAATVVLVLAAASSSSLANDFVHGIGTGEQPPAASMPAVEALGHQHDLFTQLGVRNRVEAAIIAHHAGLTRDS